MKIERLYRLAYKSNDKSLESNFYPTKEEALSHLEVMKDWIQELYEWDEGTEQYRSDMLQEGIVTDEILAKWKEC